MEDDGSISIDGDRITADWRGKFLGTLPDDFWLLLGGSSNGSGGGRGVGSWDIEVPDLFAVDHSLVPDSLGSHCVCLGIQ